MEEERKSHNNSNQLQDNLIDQPRQFNIPQPLQYQEGQHNIPNQSPPPHENNIRNRNMIHAHANYQKKRCQYIIQMLIISALIIAFIFIKQTGDPNQLKIKTWAYTFLSSSFLRSIFMWLDIYTLYKQGFIKNSWQIMLALYHLLCFTLFICYNSYAYSLHSFSNSDSPFNILLIFSLAIGYLFYYEIAIVIILVLIIVPIICCVACCCPRRGAMPSWTPTPQALLNRLTKTKFQEQSHVSMKDCIICQEEYVEGQELITLDCDERHYFHSQCITEWLTRNGVCPICRMPVNVLGRSLNRQNQRRQQ